MPNRRVVTKKRSTALIRQQIEWAVYDMADVTPLPYSAKADKSSSYFPLCSESDAEESHLSTTALLFTLRASAQFHAFRQP